MSDGVFQHAGHLKVLRLDHRKEVLKTAIGKLARMEFDAIAFCGMSGALIAPSLAASLKREIIMVRKEDDCNNHSPYRVEGYVSAQTYIFVDDFVGTGSTFEHVLTQIQGFAPHARCLGYYQYILADTPWRTFYKPTEPLPEAPKIPVAPMGYAPSQITYTQADVENLYRTYIIDSSVAADLGLFQAAPTIEEGMVK